MLPDHQYPLLPAGAPPRRRRVFPPIRLTALLAFSLLAAGCGEGWPPLPGVEERGRQPGDTWETLRGSSPWKRPLSTDPTYQRLAEVYRRLTALDEEARSRGLSSQPGYIEARYHADGSYAGARSLVFRLRSSGTEENPHGQTLISAALENLDRAVEDLAAWLAAAGRATSTETPAP